MPPTAREAIRIVERDGWYHVGTRGSHRQFRHPVKPGRVTIPGPLGRELKRLGMEEYPAASGAEMKATREEQA